MALWECRHAEWHDDSDWHEVKAYDARSAATTYAEHLDGEDSEAWVDPSADPQPILVREHGCPDAPALYMVSFDYYKSFRARRERVGA